MEKIIQDMALKARKASRKVATAGTAAKNRALALLCESLAADREMIQAENQKDVDAARERGLSAAMVDRLTLSDKVMDAMIQGVREVALLPDPVGTMGEVRLRPSGIRVGKMRIPLGVIAMIYESRPNVTVDAAALCLKAGNAVILRGGSEAFYSNMALAKTVQSALEGAGLPAHAVQVLPMTDREALPFLLQQEELIDLVIPRGGEGLIRFVTENSRIPVLKHYKGVCHLYVDVDADKEKALAILMNAKCQRPGVCNALETLLVHEKVADSFLPLAAEALEGAGVLLRGCPRTCALVKNAEPATDADWPSEYLDLILSVKVVDSLDDAMDHISLYNSGHTESIITENWSRAWRFIREVDASAVMVNASTRFNDGGELGLGAEIGISTSKLHAYGPMGLVELTTEKFVVFGDGQVRA
ncbi:glutamate-5-semialdehyde dehydrogenase [Desulfobotulus alkaliphilus]|uniref:Gamma-glutamyl phosphate reductase n=1 Tax=Desulfobotulus alkaliphilus TaxID=622671 RepID=A0A562R4F4_9BACT|nr:glutamate-5-semialdehyde dehydrogenase [Desulfobotulus alkaliphilus]TWI63921.1 glutamate-5-semialdehyde dehydrogenase [Desulfobotulus alkaliphilus]